VIEPVWFTTLTEAHDMPAVTARICSRKGHFHRHEYRDLNEARSTIRISLEKVYTRNAFTPRSTMYHRRSSKPTSSHNKRRPLRGSLLDEFFRHWGNLSIRSV
jgi:hypothetical protein